MADGRRDSFAENVGDFLLDDGESDFGMDFPKIKRRRKKTKKRRSMGRKSHKKRRKHSKRRKVTKRKSRSKGKKRKGMSKEFLRKLRQKHGLGEYKK